jgi:hypothetical protein
LFAKHLRTAAVVFGLLLYAAAFYVAPLASLETNDHQPLRRIDLIQAVHAKTFISHWFGSPAQFTFADRLPVLLAAGLILAWAAVAGRLLLTLCRLDRELTRLELFVFSTAVGFNVLSTWMLLAGLLGCLNRMGVVVVPMSATFLIAAGVCLCRNSKNCNQKTQMPLISSPKESGGGIGVHWLWLSLPFVIAIVLTAVLPPTDYDVCEYHLQAPKEFFLQGSITFLPHNVYAGMPLGAEMLSLLAMVSVGDWWWGALVGKTVIAAFTPLCAAGIFAAGRRLHSVAAGVVAALVYISIPGIVAISPAGLVEGVSACYAFLAIYTLLLPDDANAESRMSVRRIVLSGYLAGAAVATKYPAALFVLIPLAAWVFLWKKGSWFRVQGNQWPVHQKSEIENLKSPATSPQSPVSGLPSTAPRPPSLFFSLPRPLICFLLAAAVGCGLWFGKNWVTTGNPTYPLLYSVFGGKTRDAEKDAQWNSVHRAHGFSAAAFGKDMARVFLTSEWLSLLLMPLAALALLRRDTSRLAFAMFGYAAFVLLAWWLLTHRLDRFLLPASPVLALAAGLGACWTQERWWRRFLEWFLLIGMATTFVMVASGPENAWFLPLAQLRNTAPRWIDPWHKYFNEHAKQGAVLAVGNAAVFDLAPKVYYNTCFDTCLFEQWVKDKTPEEIRREFASRHIAYVFVGWEELAQLRKAGYGGEPFVEPAVFLRLVRQGILTPLPPLRGYPQEVLPHAFRVLENP